MANVSTLNFTSLQKHLRSFRQKLRPVLKACNVEFDSDFILEKTNNKFQLSKLAKFIGVQQRPGNRSGKPRLNIFLHFGGELDDRDCVIKYRIRVSYTLVKKQAQPEEICLVRGTHYDFNSASELLHPICHAQEDITTLKDEIDKDYNIQNAEQIDQFQKKYLFAVKSARVPTAFFDFFSVVIMVLADHCIKKDMPEQIEGFNEILNFVIEELPEISLQIGLLPDNSTLIRNTNIAKLHSAHWYATRGL